MAGDLFGVLGGLGLFLVGMSVMTEGLKHLAGDSLHRALARFTTTPTTGAITGAMSTAILQSSSATTVMAVGFAGAGLLTFSQALGVVFGANLGTTITGWLVALLGFKLSLSKIVMPLVFVGALMRLLGRPRVRSIGYALAGFGLVFMGIDMLQASMEGMGDVLTPASFPPNTFVGRLQLVMIGILITLVTQSSSAGVATAITAVHVGTISLPQAAAMVIGMDVGTTFTAAIASIGGGVNARRTGIAHVVYNLITGMGAFLILPIFVSSWNAWAPAGVQSDPEIALVGFHSLFNGLGVLAVLPFSNQFAALIEWLVPGRDQRLLQRLDPSLLELPAVALDAINATLHEITAIVFRSFGNGLDTDGDTSAMVHELDEAEEVVHQTRRYLAQLEVSGESAVVNARYASCWHLVDHLSRLLRRGRVSPLQQTYDEDADLRRTSDQISHSLLAWSDQKIFPATSVGEAAEKSLAEIVSAEDLFRSWKVVDRHAGVYRQEIVLEASHSKLKPKVALKRMESMRWLRRVAYHAWRIAYHLDPAIQQSSGSEDEVYPLLDPPPDEILVSESGQATEG